MTDTAAERATTHAYLGETITEGTRTGGIRTPGTRTGRAGIREPRAAAPQAGAGPLPAGRTDAVVFAVGDAERAALRYATALGLRCTAYAGPDTGEPETRSYVLQGPGSRFVVTSVVQVIGEHGRMLAAHLAAHGDGVVDLAVAVSDVHYAYDYAVDRGAVSHAEPYEVQDHHGTVVLAVIGVPGGTRHTLVDRSGYAGPYLPGYVALEI